MDKVRKPGNSEVNIVSVAPRHKKNNICMKVLTEEKRD
jgi:hypothetical protein